MHSLSRGVAAGHQWAPGESRCPHRGAGSQRLPGASGQFPERSSIRGLQHEACVAQLCKAVCRLRRRGLKTCTTTVLSAFVTLIP